MDAHTHTLEASLKANNAKVDSICAAIIAASVRIKCNYNPRDYKCSPNCSGCIYSHPEIGIFHMEEHDHPVRTKVRAPAGRGPEYQLRVNDIKCLLLISAGTNGKRICSIDKLPDRNSQREFRIRTYKFLQTIKSEKLQFVFAMETYRIPDCVKLPCRCCKEYHRPECDDTDRYQHDWELSDDEVGDVLHHGAVRIAIDEFGLTKAQRIRRGQHRENCRRLRLQMIAVFRSYGFCADLIKPLVSLLPF